MEEKTFCWMQDIIPIESTFLMDFSFFFFFLFTVRNFSCFANIANFFVHFFFSLILYSSLCIEW